ncbi:MAG: TIGR02757 family protein [Bdellovibrionia bacterium]
MKPFLQALEQKYHREEYLHSDPLELVHRYEDPWDQEAVGLLAALLAYGKVGQIRKSIQNTLDRIHAMSDSPKAWVHRFQDPRFVKKAYLQFEGFTHRFNTGEDIVQLFHLLSKSWSRYGSLGGHFCSRLEDHSSIEKPLSELIRDWRQQIPSTSRSFNYLLTSPEEGSCCKRWCLFLRWMGRKDGLDPGLWTEHSLMSRTFPTPRRLSSDQLVMPLDTHTGRISQYLGLTLRKSLNWRAALEVTESLKKVDERDPTRYDFALSRLGILELCQKSYRKEICQSCQLLPVCRFAQQRA